MFLSLKFQLRFYWTEIQKESRSCVQSCFTKSALILWDSYHSFLRFGPWFPWGLFRTEERSRGKVEVRVDMSSHELSLPGVPRDNPPY